MSRVTGKPLDGDAHLAQSIGDLLTTPLGTRVMRRDYGSALLDLIDAPLNAATRIRLYAATALAILRWEPRLSLTRVAIEAGPAGYSNGSVSIVVEGKRADRPAASAATSLTIPLRA